MRTSPALAAALAVTLAATPVLVSLPAVAADGPQASLIRDIHPAGGSDPRALTRVGDLVFFTAADGTHGRELWVTDGSTDGTRLVRDIRPGSSGSAPRDLTAVGDRLFFTAIDGTHGREPWVSDGTRAGTRIVRDLTPGANGTYLAGIAALGETAFLAVRMRELWRSDGTWAGTRPVRTFENLDLWMTEVLRGALHFRADRGVWRSDGTPDGTRRISPPLVDIAELTRFSGRLWFMGADPAIGWCCEAPVLWRSDGTRAGTRRVPGAFVPTDLTVLGGRLYLNAVRSAGPRLFASDGSVAGTGPVVPRVRPLLGMLGAAGRLWATVMREPRPWADALWVSDGTAGGTARISGDGPDWFTSDDPLEAVGLAGRLWFAAGPGEIIDGEWTLTDHELWLSGGTSDGTVQAVDIHPTGSSFPRELVRLGRSVVFSATDGEHGRELWVAHP
jgi:ELWxxDGT repeat protein